MEKLRTPRTTLFPYTTLFRSEHAREERAGSHRAGLAVVLELELDDLVERPEPGDDALEVVLALARDPDGVTLDLRDRKSTRLNSSHLVISYAVFCLKIKNGVV